MQPPQLSPSIENDQNIKSYSLAAVRLVDSGLYLKIDTAPKVKKVAFAIPMATLDGLLSIVGRTFAAVELIGNGFRILFKNLIKNEEGFFVKTALLHFQASLEMIGSLVATILFVPIQITYQAGALMFQSTMVDQFDKNNISTYLFKNKDLSESSLFNGLFASDDKKNEAAKKILKDLLATLAKV